MTRLLHISDLHFGAEVPEVVEALVRLSAAASPDVLVVSGDLTQRATDRQFALARRFIERLAVPVTLVIPGNHDISLHKPWERLLNPYRPMRAAFGDELEPAHETENLLVLTVNTTRAYRHKNGEVSGSQVERVAQRLRHARPGQLRLVVTHQPAEVYRPQDVADRLRRHRHALRTWAAAGADLLLGGHIHLPYLVAVPPLDGSYGKTIWVMNAGTAVSSRVRHEARQSVNLLHVESDAGGRVCRAERWDHSPAAGAFQRVAADELRFSEDAS